MVYRHLKGIQTKLKEVVHQRHGYKSGLESNNVTEKGYIYTLTSCQRPNTRPKHHIPKLYNHFIIIHEQIILRQRRLIPNFIKEHPFLNPTSLFFILKYNSFPWRRIRCSSDRQSHCRTRTRGLLLLSTCSSRCIRRRCTSLRRRI